MTALTKICGLSTPETLEAAIAGGASHIGLVHYSPSPRHLTLDAAATLRAQAAGRVQVVLLLVNPHPREVVTAYEAVRPDVLQFHGTETPDYMAKLKEHSPAQIWKAFGVRDAGSLERSSAYTGAVHRILYDAPAQALPGGTGTRFDWSLLAGHAHAADWGLAGGLSPETVADAIRATGAPLVDVSSGVESAPGVKDVDKIAAFLKAAQNA
jgi:phosphoribosylanthranilate isomerase